MILNGIAVAKQSSGMAEQADYVKSKLSVQTEAQAAFEVTEETMQKYPGDYETKEGTIKVVLLKDGKTLNLISSHGPAMELTPLSKDKFTVKYMDGLSVEFTINEKDEVTEMLLTMPGGQVKASRKK
jgi:hypothetical protein